MLTEYASRQSENILAALPVPLDPSAKGERPTALGKLDREAALGPSSSGPAFAIIVRPVSPFFAAELVLPNQGRFL